MLSQRLAPLAPLDRRLLTLTDDHALDQLVISRTLARENELLVEWLPTPFRAEDCLRLNLAQKEQAHESAARIGAVSWKQTVGVGVDDRHDRASLSLW